MKKFLFSLIVLTLVGLVGLMANSPSVQASPSAPAAPRTCTYVTLVYTSTVLSKAWDGQTSGCYVVTTSQAGDFKVNINSWVFDSVTLNGSPITTTTKAGELAQQITPFTMTVTAGQNLIFEVTAVAPHSAELGLRVSYAAPIFNLFLPMIKK